MCVLPLDHARYEILPSIRLTHAGVGKQAANQVQVEDTVFVLIVRVKRELEPIQCCLRDSHAARLSGRRRALLDQATGRVRKVPRRTLTLTLPSAHAHFMRPTQRTFSWVEAHSNTNITLSYSYLPPTTWWFVFTSVRVSCLVIFCLFSPFHATPRGPSGTGSRPHKRSPYRPRERERGREACDDFFFLSLCEQH